MFIYTSPIIKCSRLKNNRNLQIVYSYIHVSMTDKNIWVCSTVYLYKIIQLHKKERVLTKSYEHLFIFPGNWYCKKKSSLVKIKFSKKVYQLKHLKNIKILTILLLHKTSEPKYNRCCQLLRMEHCAQKRQLFQSYFYLKENSLKNCFFYRIWTYIKFLDLNCLLR